MRSILIFIVFFSLNFVIFGLDDLVYIKNELASYTSYINECIGMEQYRKALKGMDMKIKCIIDIFNKVDKKEEEILCYLSNKYANVCAQYVTVAKKVLSSKEVEKKVEEFEKVKILDECPYSRYIFYELIAAAFGKKHKLYKIYKRKAFLEFGKME